MKKIKLFECGCCGGFHKETFMGDCRDDSNRYYFDGEYYQAKGRKIKSENVNEIPIEYQDEDGNEIK